MSTRVHVKRRRSRAWCLSAVSLLCVLMGRAHADEASGSWTGELEARGNYYLEGSTRVMIPTARLAIEAPNGVRMSASYLVDIISTASIAAGPMGDEVFTELRHGVGGSVGKTFALGDNELDLNAHVLYSGETDYRSWIYGMSGGFSWNEKNTTLVAGLTLVSDAIYANNDPDFRGTLKGETVSLGFTQLLSPTLSFGLGYEFVHLGGFLGNPYRSIRAGAAPTREQPPSQRYRHNGEVQLSWFLPATSTTLQAYVRLYTDSWEVRAITPEMRVYQALGRDVTLRLRYRYYSQSQAYFALDDSMYPGGYVGPTTNDPKLLDFHSQTLGARFTFALRGLEGTVLDFVSRGLLDVSFDRQWCTSTFGNNIMGTLGGRLPF